MSSTNAYAAKRAIIDRLKELAAGTSGPLAGVQVLYAFSGVMQNVCVYGGGVTFDQPGDDDAVEGRSRIPRESAFVGIHIRVAKSPPGVDGIRDTDIVAEEIGDAIAEEFADNPHIGGGHSVSRIFNGQGDYSPNDDSAVSTLSLRINVDSWVTTERQQP